MSRWSKGPPPQRGREVKSLAKDWRPGALQALLIVLLTLMAYFPAFHAGFIWDDDAHVTQNKLLGSVHGLSRIWFEPTASQQYYPLQLTSYWIERHLWGLQPFGYHFVNVLLHSLVAILFWRVLSKLQLPGAWLAGAIFALHPVGVESVAWVSERKTVLSAAFYLAAVLAYGRYALWLRGDGRAPETGARGQPSAGPGFFYLLSLGLFSAALLSKTVACSLPAALLVICWWKKGKVRWVDVLPLLPFFVLGLWLGLMTAHLERTHVMAQGVDWALTFLQRCLIAGRAVWFYAGKLAWPSHLTFIYPRWAVDAGVWWQWLFPLAAGGVVAALALLRPSIGRGPLAAVLFFAGTLFPALGFFNVYPMRFSFVADHFQYLASLGLIAMAAAGLSRLPKAIKWLPVLMLLLLGVLTWQQTRIYHDPETLWRDTLANNSAAWLAHNNLGVVLEDQGKWDQAEAHYDRALQINPNHADAHINLANILTARGKWNPAMVHYQEALRLSPQSAAVHFNLGNLLTAREEWDEAVAQYQQALQLKPDYAEACNNLGNALASQGRLPEAIRSYERALRFKPDYSEAHNNWANALARQKKLPQAIEHYERALSFKADYAEAHYNLGVALVGQQKLEEAIYHFRRVLQLKPDDAEARNSLGIAIGIQGNTDEAISQFQEALRLKPDFSAARDNLARALEMKNAPVR